jgi:aspartyl-tRNA synthetase
LDACCAGKYYSGTSASASEAWSPHFFSGVGLRINRLCMMQFGQESIRDVILFPQLKPK